MVAIRVGPSDITINQDDRFVVSGVDGRIRRQMHQGFFAADTRFVSGHRVTLNGLDPILLNASGLEHFSSRYEFTSPELPVSDGGPGERLAARQLHLRIDRSIAGGVHEDYELTSYARRRVAVLIEIAFESDFADVFDVRAGTIVRRGTIQSAWDEGTGELRTVYVNGDFRRELIIGVAKTPDLPQYANGRLAFVCRLEPGVTWHACVYWLPILEPGERPAVLDCHAMVTAASPAAQHRLPPVDLRSPNHAVKQAWDQARADLEALRISRYAMGKGVFVPAAGVPWFVTLFGRDSLIVSMESIMGFPDFAQGALARLALFQADRDDPDRDMEPGKILHEIRFGELAALRLLPWAPYYGSHDATSLFIIVLSYLYQWSNDVELTTRYRPNAEAALAWIDRYGDLDGDGFQEYRRRSSKGLFNQGWKDSGDGILDEAGRIPQPPIALCELQGYVYDAKLRMADLYQLWGEPERAESLRAEAHGLFERFNDAFWWEEEGTYYLGLDGDKRPLRTVASNAGLCMSNGIVPAERASRVIERLMAEDMFSGWGIRTLSARHPGYDPFGYHIGTVWPHDNAAIAGGLRRYGGDGAAARVAEGIFAAAERFERSQLPELFAGLPREPGAFPVQYLGANVPQAWAAAAVFRLIAVMCGVHCAAPRGTLYANPALPDWLPSLEIHNLRAADGSLDLRFAGTQMEVLRNSSGLEVVHGRAPLSQRLGREGDEATSLEAASR